MSALRAVVRIARRDAAKAKLRSALVVAMIALPVLGVGAADVMWRTFQLSPDQKATRLMGAADAVVEDTGVGSITQRADGSFDAGQPRQGPPLAVSAIIPPGSRTLALRQGSGRVTFGQSTAEAELRVLDYLDPLARGLVFQRTGRPAAGPHEVVLTAHLAQRLDVTLGDGVTLEGRRLTVVGVVDDASRRDAQAALLSTAPAAWDGTRTSMLVKVPRHLTWADVERANAAGFLLRPRFTLPGTPPLPYDPLSRISPATLTAVSLVVGMVLLEIVLLAGPAFAVGAKRQSRDLALLAACGGDRRDVRRTVLGGGLVLGAAAGVLGVLLGALLAKGGVGVLSRRTGDVPGPFDIRPLELAGVVLVGITTAVLAALLPARNAARQDVVAALTGRRGQLRSLRRTPVLGAVAAVAGALVALEGARRRNVNVILAGSMLAELGLVATTPFLVGLVGRLSPQLPLGPRLALRDASRNRGRAAPAVSAVLAAVAGSVAIGTYMASLDQYNREAYEPRAASDSVVVPFFESGMQAKADRVQQLLRQELPGNQTRVVTGLGGSEGPRLELSTPAVHTCQLAQGTALPTRAQLLAARRDPACSGVNHGHDFPADWLVGGPADLRVLTGNVSAAQEAALRRGGAVVPARNIDSRGFAHVTISDTRTNRVLRTFVIAAAAADPRQVPVTLLSPQAAARSGVPPTLVGVASLGRSAPSASSEDRIRKQIEDMGLHGLLVERGYVSRYRAGLLALSLASALIVLGASGIATGLAAADGKADLATLAAVGASPRTRRSLAAFQSAVIAVLGTLLGVAAGLVPAVGMVRALNSAALHASFPRLDPYPLVLPWNNLLVTVLVVPLLAAGAAALLTRSRLPMVRRIG